MPGGADTTALVTVGVSVIALGAETQRADELRSLTERASGAERADRLSAGEQADEADPLEIAWLFRGEPATTRNRPVGAALSHLAVWRSLAGRREESLELVLEDTAVLTAGFADRLPEIVAALREAAAEFDLAFLGYRSPTAEEDAGGLRAMRWERYLGGTSGYAVSSAGARRLLEIVGHHGLPYSLERLLAVQGPALRALECDPPLITAAAPAPVRRPTAPSRRPNRGAVAIYLGASWAPWHPMDIVTRGLGGSETACYRLASALTELGYAVTLYGDFDQAVIGGVQLRPWRTFNPGEPRRGLISSRKPELFDAELAADATLLWTHDADFQDRLTPERSAGVDAVVCLSAWHRGHLAKRYPWIADKLVTVRNGIVPDYFTRDPVPARARRVLFSSSPDRGLDVLLELWPLVREQVPDAELVHLYAPVYDAVADQDPVIAAHRESIRALTRQPAVRRLDGLSQPALAQLMRASLVWAHPSYITAYSSRFPETSCIGAMEAQAAGCCVVAADWGALPETVRVGTLIDGDPAGDDFKARFAAAIVAGLTDPELQRTAQTQGPPAVLSWDWGGVAEMIAREIERLAARRTAPAGSPA